MNLRVRNMGADELAGVLDWAASEGWNPGHDDAAPFHATDPEGFFLAEVAGQPVAAISVVNHGADCAFLGLYLCLPDYRGQGIAYALWQHALTHAGARVMGLDGVPDQQENYRKSGFVLTGQTYRFSGTIAGQTDPALRAVRPGDIAMLTDLEARANGYAKPAFMAAWCLDIDTRHTLVLDRDGVAGFVTLRACRAGFKIGPLVAGSMEDGEILIRAAAARAEGQIMMIDVPDDCAPLMAWCEGQGLSVSFNTARMYRGTPPQGGTQIRAIATMELG